MRIYKNNTMGWEGDVCDVYVCMCACLKLYKNKFEYHLNSNKL